jgi:hypothetical protein
MPARNRTWFTLAAKYHCRSAHDSLDLGTAKTLRFEPICACGVAKNFDLCQPRHYANRAKSHMQLALGENLETVKCCGPMGTDVLSRLVCRSLRCYQIIEQVKRVLRLYWLHRILPVPPTCRETLGSIVPTRECQSFAMTPVINPLLRLRAPQTNCETLLSISLYLLILLLPQL